MNSMATKTEVLVVMVFEVVSSVMGKVTHNDTSGGIGL